MVKDLFTALRVFLLLTLIFGVIYPSLVTLAAQIMPYKANGSLLNLHGEVVGSELLGQKFISPTYFHSRPSATDYSSMPSGASNLSVTSRAFQERFLAIKNHGENVPSDLLTTSGSGLDPHISPRAAFYQILRIAQSRSLSQQGLIKLQHMVMSQVELPTFGFLGNPRVNVLKLNILLDREMFYE